MDVDTTDPSYWLNWRFLICALFVLGSMVFASLLIWKYERAKKSEDGRTEPRQAPAGVLYKDDLWRTCLKGIHPAWLLAFRIFAFVVLLAFIIGNAIAEGLGIFFYYTQWTFTLTTMYFAIASAFSFYGCWHDRGRVAQHKGISHIFDVEPGYYAFPRLGSSEDTSMLKSLCNHEEVNVRQIAGSVGDLFQIIYQVSAGAVVLTDIVFWLIMYPFLSAEDFGLNFYNICMHSVNILILGDALLNCMRFPMFRIAYFMLWTAAFVIYQWIIHACVNLYWPYPFMELSTPYAPLWYTVVGLLHFPCYGFFALIVKLKNLWLSRSFPDSYQAIR
uniref:Uncharacterized protein n=1 Tax=Opuntia streptacantha TaxID=393608 RepID=A0A7C9E1E2_OPUST